jgi:hypothetical protein
LVGLAFVHFKNPRMQSPLLVRFLDAAKSLALLRHHLLARQRRSCFTSAVLISCSGMYTIRRLLDFLAEHSSGAINRLCEIREVGGRSRDAKCESLACSYRGDHALFFEDLRKQDLVALLNDPTEIDGKEFYLPNTRAYSHLQLVNRALRLFRDEKPSSDFCALSDEDQVEDNEEIDVITLGNLTATTARNEDRLGPIARVTELSELVIRRRLEGVHGKMLIRNVFENEWPHAEDDEEEEDIDVTTLGDMTVTTARDDDHTSEIARVTDLSQAVVHRRLDDAHGKTLVRNLFREKWPSDDRNLVTNGGEVIRR